MERRTGIAVDAVQRVGSYLQVQDEEGCRHLLRVTAVQALSDTDPLRNETFITAAGRTIRVPQSLDAIVGLIAPGERLGADAEAAEAPWPF